MLVSKIRFASFPKTFGSWRGFKLSKCTFLCCLFSFTTELHSFILFKILRVPILIYVCMILYSYSRIKIKICNYNRKNIQKYNSNNKWNKYTYDTQKKKNKEKWKHKTFSRTDQVWDCLFDIYLQVLQFYVGPNQLLIHVLHFLSHVSLFGSAYSMFQMWGSRTYALLSPNVTEFRTGTLGSSLCLFEFTFFETFDKRAGCNLFTEQKTSSAGARNWRTSTTFASGD